MRARGNVFARDVSPVGTNNSCGVQNAARRREWGYLEPTERQSYIDAVKCLGNLPTTLDPAKVPGARTRYDDFVFAHMDQSQTIHDTGNFLTWHRHFIFLFESALRNECGYEGYQPYWNWARHSDDPRKSPVFDGSDLSLGGTGLYDNYTAYEIGDPPLLTVSNQGGGGCITNGPFKDWKVNLGPVSTKLDNIKMNDREDGYAYNPRCIRRDLNPAVSTAALKDSDVARAISEPQTIEDYQAFLNGIASRNIPGIHGAGHFTIGGDPGSDFYTSPADPAFWFHHTMLDRVFWTWQNQELDNANRLNVVHGTRTRKNEPPSPNAMLDDVIGADLVGESTTIRAALDTMSGFPYCFCYD
ncbi:Di-copper centre-containing protein [Eremomyces bilateralis CBS 781.70]|uniref:Di-copper centre-containing protein n=1 Tax=Eremomyces bilateralis CBS 781.70 TaxID=1392243 RepID=A0A6G1FWN2_9PEZI|nr:Di-copper centre-containing protein [Eremomyces bilateralis CBS 781.70]KAF1810295.1 Di-copper centre-containing protein [Eremomyces bilateralis CBS 781.70]